MIIATISFHLHGGVTLLREGERLSEKEVKEINSNRDRFFGPLPISVKKNHKVSLVEKQCLLKINLTQEAYDSIIDAHPKSKNKNFPSRATLKEQNLTLPKYLGLSPYNKLLVYFSDHMYDLRAKGITINFLN